MDSPVVSRLFRQLFRHLDCRPRRNFAFLASSLQLARRHQLHHQQHRPYASAPRRDRSNESDWQQRTDLFPADMSVEYAEYPMVTAQDLRLRRERPRRVKMLMRDFIEDSLYNPHYGYFSKQVVIFTPGEPFRFTEMRDEPEFSAILSQRYSDFEDGLDAAAVAQGGEPSETRQLWYTPTELFRPHYGEAVARYLVANYMLTSFPYDDLIIYEMGAGRGTMMLNILDYLRVHEPAVYARTRYRIIEISSSLASLQRRELHGSPATSPAATAAADRGHGDRVEIINQSVFDWTTPEPSPCFFLAFEVFDNFAHDCVRYDLASQQPLQAVVLVAADGDLYEFYQPQLDPVAARFLRVRNAATAGHYPLPFSRNPLVRALRRGLFSTGPAHTPSLSRPEYLPTRLLDFFAVLARFFPAHRLLTSDFHALPDAITGLNAPVVQTRFQRRPVPVSTPLVHQGYFDIMFPTDFTVVEALYRAVTGKHSRVATHEHFMRNWASLDQTRTRSGESPLLSWYKNASMLATI
ncbi:cog1565 domain containing protein [Grosmannia clavigera kw1407]|uniref:Protein arginine methyltransferase NDUFAF7 n=1 Tax=Grosmannia clavigera (strain kw1407 / UAMH 11150) TaxID=655863 RepID=F0XN22_GROCL|nr:cog1565 domain containing protein [Grosmannia clavigera kw1407]EFX00783.1 cog1565 domain containing protein [Grosmannia clavigera kw1407]